MRRDRNTPIHEFLSQRGLTEDETDPASMVLGKDNSALAAKGQQTSGSNLSFAGKGPANQRG